MYVCMYSMYVCVCVCVYVCMMYVCMYVCIYVCMCVCVCVCMYECNEKNYVCMTTKITNRTLDEELKLHFKCATITSFPLQFLSKTADICY